MTEHVAREAIARSDAATCSEFRERGTSGLATATSEIEDLPPRRRSQVDFDRDRFFPSVAAISSSRSSVSGTTRPAARSSKPWRTPSPSSAARSRSNRITSARSRRSFAWFRSRSTACFTAASEPTSTRTGVTLGTGSRTPASIHERIVGCENPSTRAASETLTPRSRATSRSRTASSERRRSGSSSWSASC